MQPYFMALYRYLLSHPSVAELHLVHQHQQVLTFIDEYAESISLFIYPHFLQDKKPFVHYVKERQKEILLPLIQNFVSGIAPQGQDGILQSPEDITNYHAVLGGLIPLFLNSEKTRLPFSLHWTMISSEYMDHYLDKILHIKDSHTAHLLEKEENRTFSTELLNRYLKNLLFLSPIVVQEQGILNFPLSETKIKSMAQALKEKYTFLSLEFIERMFHLYLPADECRYTWTISRLGAVFSARSYFPQTQGVLKGALSSDVSWFSSKFRQSSLDKRILKELWTIAEKEGY